MANVFRKKEPNISEMNKGKIVTADEEKDKDEWIWVAGYKGTKADMICNEFHYELGKKYDMSEDEKIELCSNGFHLCIL